MNSYVDIYIIANYLTLVKNTIGKSSRYSQKSARDTLEVLGGCDGVSVILAFFMAMGQEGIDKITSS